MPNYIYQNSRQRRKAKNASDIKYKKAHQTAFTLRYHNVNDADVIAKLKSVDNKIDYVRQLILKDIIK